MLGLFILFNRLLIIITITLWTHGYLCVPGGCALIGRWAVYLWLIQSAILEFSPFSHFGSSLLESHGKVYSPKTQMKEGKFVFVLNIHSY